MHSLGRMISKYFSNNPPVVHLLMAVNEWMAVANFCFCGVFFQPQIKNPGAATPMHYVSCEHEFVLVWQCRLGIDFTAFGKNRLS